MTSKKCGCYDGPYSSATPTIMVSVRCIDHRGKFAKPGYSLMYREENGVVHSVAPRDTHTLRDLSLAAQRKRNAARSRKDTTKK